MCFSESRNSDSILQGNFKAVINFRPTTEKSDEDLPEIKIGRKFGLECVFASKVEHQTNQEMMGVSLFSAATFHFNADILCFVIFPFCNLLSIFIGLWTCEGYYCVLCLHNTAVEIRYYIFFYNYKSTSVFTQCIFLKSSLQFMLQMRNCIIKERKLIDAMHCLNLFSGGGGAAKK